MSAFGLGEGEIASAGVAHALLRRELESEPELCIVTGSGGLPACELCWPCRRASERLERRSWRERVRAWLA